MKLQPCRSSQEVSQGRWVSTVKMDVTTAPLYWFPLTNQTETYTTALKYPEHVQWMPYGCAWNRSYARTLPPRLSALSPVSIEFRGDSHMREVYHHFIRSVCNNTNDLYKHEAHWCFDGFHFQCPGLHVCYVKDNRGEVERPSQGRVPDVVVANWGHHFTAQKTFYPL
jgi:hypothetical protein